MLSKVFGNSPLSLGRRIPLAKPKVLAIGISTMLPCMGNFGISPVMGAQSDGVSAVQSDSTNTKSVPLDQVFNEPPASQWLVGKDLTIRDWLVVGSGCPMTRLSAPGGTKVKLVPSGAKGYDVNIEVEQYELDGKKPFNPGNATFARECTMLLSVYPAAGKKLANVQADVAISAKKSANVAVNVTVRAVLGTADLSSWERKLDKGKSAGFDEKIHLSGNGKTAFERLDCEQAKLVGTVYSFVNFRDSFKDEVLIRLNGGKTRVHLDFADCSVLEISNNAPLGGPKSAISPK